METQPHSSTVEVGSFVRRRRERGASLVEYALLVALIALVCIVAVTFFGTQTGDTFSRVGSSVQAT